MGTTVPSGMVVVVGVAVRLTVFWPKAVAAKRRIPPTMTAAFSVALNFKSLLVIIFASRCRLGHKT
jgi:hypothetical protein